MRHRRIMFGHPHPAKHFTGREAELEILHERLQVTDRALITQAITGLGGVGKTQLAARYVQRHSHAYEIVAWVHAEDGGISDLAVLAVTLGLDVGELAPDERAAQAVAWLSRCEQRWLLVLDNVDNPAQLDICAPASGNGRVLITSRNRDLEHHGPVLSIDVFDDQTAVEYLIARTGRRDDQDDALRLAQTLGGLPLALAHAGAYCAKTTSFEAYFQRGLSMLARSELVALL
jgi:hypothetical protein